MHRQAEFGAFLCLTVPKTRVLSPKTGPTGRVSGKKLPVGREREGEREKEGGREGKRKEEERKKERGRREKGRRREKEREGEGRREKERESSEIGSFALIVGQMVRKFRQNSYIWRVTPKQLDYESDKHSDCRTGSFSGNVVQPACADGHKQGRGKHNGTQEHT